MASTLHSQFKLAQYKRKVEEEAEDERKEHKVRRVEKGGRHRKQEELEQDDAAKETDQPKKPLKISQKDLRELGSMSQNMSKFPKGFFDDDSKQKEVEQLLSGAGSSRHKLAVSKQRQDPVEPSADPAVTAADLEVVFPWFIYKLLLTVDV